MVFSVSFCWPSICRYFTHLNQSLGRDFRAATPTTFSRRRMKHALSVLPLVTAVSLGLTASARAATQTVTNLNDSGTGSLRTAITAAASGDTVVFQSGLNGTITLASVLPTISKNLTIQGPGASIITVSGANLYRVFNIGSVVVNVSGITIANGSVASGNGAGISSS